mgnify:CR=1 FL=1
MIDKQNAETLLKRVQQVQSLAHELESSSLPEYTAGTRLSPVVLVDKALTLVEDTTLPNILQTMVSIYSAHYLQAVAIATDVEGVNTMKLLDQFSTDRDLLGGGAAGRGYMDMWDKYKNSSKLPSPNKLSGTMPSLEAKDDDLQGHVNLAIGRLLHVKIGVGQQSTTIPVSVVLNPRVINSNDLPGVMAMVDADTTIMGRYHKWRSGEIESFMDYVFALDLIEKDKKALLSDDSGIYKQARTKKTKSLFKTLVTGKKSLNTASTMAVITNSTAVELELALKGRLNNARDRHRYFDATNSMMLVVVDPRRERLTIYQRGIANPGTYTFTDIEDHGSKGSSMDISSILKAYKLGESPSL